MVEDKINLMEVHRPQHREPKWCCFQEVNKWIIILIFLLGDKQHAHFNEGYNKRYSPPTFLSPGFNNTLASDAVGRSIIQLAENQSHSLDFILVGQQSQMDAYREMTCSNQAREDDALFAGIEVYNGEDPS